MDSMPPTKIIDSHIHFGHPEFRAGLMAVIDRAQIDRLNIVCTPSQQRLSLVPDALHLKAHQPDRVYVFGGLDISALFMMPEQCGEFFAGYVDTLRQMGCDGIKMIEGKPQIRKMLPLPPFDSPQYAPYWEKMAQDQIPIIFHVNDPEEFWDAERIPSWAVEAGWFYGQGGFIDNEVQYREVLNVLDRNPDLVVIFAHFFFLSAQLERLAEYLDRYPGMHIDLTPGVEMYYNFAANPQKTRDFFIRFQDRILYGTDIGAKALLATPEQGIEMGESLGRVKLVRTFLETDGEFWLDPHGGYLLGDQKSPFQGLGLPLPIREKIYHKNFERLAGVRPRSLDPNAIIAECERLITMIGVMGAAQPGMAGDPSIAQIVKTYFETNP